MPTSHRKIMWMHYWRDLLAQRNPTLLFLLSGLSRSVLRFAQRAFCWLLFHDPPRSVYDPSPMLISCYEPDHRALWSRTETCPYLMVRQFCGVSRRVKNAPSSSPHLGRGSKFPLSPRERVRVRVAWLGACATRLTTCQSRPLVWKHVHTVGMKTISYRDKGASKPAVSPIPHRRASTLLLAPPLSLCAP